jgi:hypothetical protein
MICTVMTLPFKLRALGQVSSKHRQQSELEKPTAKPYAVLELTTMGAYVSQRKAVPSAEQPDLAVPPALTASGVLLMEQTRGTPVTVGRRLEGQAQAGLQLVGGLVCLG